jgi:putative holliday junction resolvase
VHRNEEYLGVDAGSARVGIARGGSLAKIAEPLATVPAAEAVEELAKLANESGAVGIVVGLPRGLDGQETAQTGAARDWVKAAKDKIKLPFYWQDEALTSRQAELRTDKKAAGADAIAASILLQDFLDTGLEERVRC